MTLKEAMDYATALVLLVIGLAERPEFPAPNHPQDINWGWCVDWAQVVADNVDGAEMVEYDDIGATDMLHTFIRYRGRYYDSETPQGVRFMRQLPCFAHPHYRRPEAA